MNGLFRPTVPYGERAGRAHSFPPLKENHDNFTLSSPVADMLFCHWRDDDGGRRVSC